MKIKEFSILHYGPLADTGRVQLKNFNLFWGKNEEGKSLTIDALVKLLFGRNTKEFEKINRVEELPEGYIIINNEEKNIKIPENGYLPEIIDLSSGECSNIFIVRDSNLAPFLNKSTEGDFYLSIIDHLTGLRSGEIEKIKKEILDIGGITPTFLFKDTKDERIKSRFEDATALLKEIEKFQTKVKSEDLDKLEKNTVFYTEQLRIIEEKCSEEGKKYIYAYDTEPDTTMHEIGCDSAEAGKLIIELNDRLEQLCERLENTIVFVVADHGHKNVINIDLKEYPDVVDCLVRNTSLEP